MAISGERPVPYPGVPPKRKKDHGPSQTDIDAANAGQLAPNAVERFIQRLGRSRTAKIGLAAGTAGVGIYAYATNPNFQQTIDSAYHNLLQILGREAVVPTTFDNKATSGVIGDKNIQFISQEEAKKSNLQPVATDTSLTFLFPFQLPEGAKITYEKSLSERLPTQAIQTEAAQKGIKDQVDLNIPRDATISASFDAHVVISMGREKYNEDPTKAVGLNIVFYNPEQDKTYQIRIFTLDSDGQKGYLDSLSPSLQLPPNYSLDLLRGTNWKQWPIAKQGQQLVKTTQNQPIRITIEAYKGDKIGPEAAISEAARKDKTASVVTPQFLTTTASGEQKLLVLTK